MPYANHAVETGTRRFPIERDGLRFIVPPLALSAIFFTLRFPWTGTVFLLLGAFCVYFFRDPERTIPVGDRIIVAPADGKVVAIKPFPDWKGPFGEPLVRVSIFLSVFDVHVTVRRSPASCKRLPTRLGASWPPGMKRPHKRTSKH